MSRVLRILILVLALVAPASAADPIRFAIFDFPPIYVEKENGVWSGEMLELLDTVAKKLGIDYTVTMFPVHRLVQSLIDGAADVTIAGPHLFIGKQVLVGAVDATMMDLRVYAIGPEPTIKTLADLRGASVIVMLGYNYGETRAFLMDPNNEIKISIEARTHEQSLSALVNRRADYLLSYVNVIAALTKDKPIENLRDVAISRVPLRLAVTETRPDAARLLERLERAMVEIKAASSSATRQN